METARTVIDSVTSAAVKDAIPEQLRVTLLEAATKLVAALQKPEVQSPNWLTRYGHISSEKCSH